MDEPNAPDQPPGLPRPPGGRVPTSRGEPPILEELARLGASGPLPPAPAPPASQDFDWVAPFRNRLIIGGVSVLVLLALTAGVTFVFSRGSGEAGRARAVSAPTGEATTPTPATELLGTALATTALHNGPSASYSILGTVPRGARVPIVGRNEDMSWLQIIFPPGSQLLGWVDAGFVEVTADLSQVVIAGPGSGPSIVVPTSPPGFDEPAATDTPEPQEEEPTDTEEPEDTATPEDAETPTTPPGAETPPPTDTQAPPPTDPPSGAVAPTGEPPATPAEALP